MTRAVPAAEGCVLRALVRLGERARKEAGRRLAECRKAGLPQASAVC